MNLDLESVDPKVVGTCWEPNPYFLFEHKSSTAFPKIYLDLELVIYVGGVGRDDRDLTSQFNVEVSREEAEKDEFQITLLKAAG